MTAQPATPAAPQPGEPTAQTPTSAATPAPPSAQAPAHEKQPPWGTPDKFDPEKAWELIQNLRKERPDPQLRSELDALKQSQTQQRDALAAALGIKPEETSDTEKLTRQLGTLQEQIIGSERRALAAEHQIPAQFHHLLTATDSEGLKRQAEALVEFAQGAHYAASTATPPPAFQQNPGQGQGNQPLSSEAQAQAEYEKYYPPTPPRR